LLVTTEAIHKVPFYCPVIDRLICLYEFAVDTGWRMAGILLCLQLSLLFSVFSVYTYVSGKFENTGLIFE